MSHGSETSGRGLNDGVLGHWKTALVRGAPVDFSITISKCEGCHGGSNASAPPLEAQASPYLAARIRSFGDLTRQNPHAY